MAVTHIAKLAAVFALIVVCAGAPNSRSTRTVTVTEGTNISATLSPDHKTLIIDLQETLWSLPVAGGAAKRLTDPFLEPARPDYSPTGNLVAFQSFKGGTFHIWLMKPDGTAIRQLTDGHGDDREPRFSPDGKRIAFSSDRAFKGNYDIWVADVESGKLTQWTSTPADEFEPAWSPDGIRIAFVSGAGANGTSIQSVDASGHTSPVIAAPQGAHINSPSWSPDGKHIAYSQFAGRRTRLMVANTPVGTADDVFPFPAAWLSSTQLLYTGNGKIFVTTLGSGETRTIPFRATFELNRAPYKRKQADFESTAARPVKGILSPALSPDGTSHRLHRSQPALGDGHRRQASRPHQRYLLQAVARLVARWHTHRLLLR